MSNKKLTPCPFRVGDVITYKWLVDPVPPKKRMSGGIYEPGSKGVKMSINSGDCYNVLEVSQEKTPRAGIRRWFMKIEKWEGKEMKKLRYPMKDEVLCDTNYWVEVKRKKIHEMRGVKQASNLGIL